MPLDNVIDYIKLVIIHNNLTQDKSEFNVSQDYISSEYGSNFINAHERASKTQFKIWIDQYQEYFENHSTEWKIFIIILYSLIILVSSFGNFIVCKIVFCNSAMRSSTTNIYIGSLSISDILMTVLNAPLQLTRILCQSWPLGNFLCRCLPFFQGLSVNVSSFTMAYIALDRYYAIAYPLRPRASLRSISFKIIMIWGTATMVSSPYPVLANVEKDITYTEVSRCRLIYPAPKYQFRQFLTLITLFIQYLIPLCITGITYFRICLILCHRRNIGFMSEEQKRQRYVSKLKTIRMLFVVFLVFTVCWLPLNIYHVYQDFSGTVANNKHNSLIFLICHWFAMSNVCYNPFLYCWLNEKFRKVTKSYMQCFLKFTPFESENSSGSNLIIQVERKKVTMQTRKISTLSSSLNFENTNKIFLDCQNCENPNNKEKCLAEKKKVKGEFVSNDLEMNDHNISINFNYEVIHLLMNAKETVL